MSENDPERCDVPSDTTATSSGSPLNTAVVGVAPAKSLTPAIALVAAHIAIASIPYLFLIKLNVILQQEPYYLTYLSISQIWAIGALIASGIQRRWLLFALFVTILHAIGWTLFHFLVEQSWDPAETFVVDIIVPAFEAIAVVSLRFSFFRIRRTEGQIAASHPFQFSIRQLLAATFVVGSYLALFKPFARSLSEGSGIYYTIRSLIWIGLLIAPISLASIWAMLSEFRPLVPSALVLAAAMLAGIVFHTIHAPGSPWFLFHLITSHAIILLGSLAVFRYYGYRWVRAGRA
jgi:hypothetical protein